jgi:nucleotide-binding universal stress UspA family protein
MIMSASAAPVGVHTEASGTAATAALRMILFPSDLSAESVGAFAHARLLAERFSARLALCHFLTARTEGRPEDDEVLRREHRMADTHLRGLTEGLERQSRVAVYEARDVPRALVRHIRNLKPDLSVMATHGRTGLARLVLGSVAEAVVRHGSGPVLCVREPEHGTALPYRRVLMPTDLSEGSRRALPWVRLLAGGFDAEVVVVHSAPFPSMPSTSGAAYVVEREVPTPMAVRGFIEPQLPGLRITVRVPWGPPVSAILETARDEKADVIVIASHGYDALGDRLRGTHTERLIRHAPCPVLAV